MLYSWVLLDLTFSSPATLSTSLNTYTQYSTTLYNAQCTMHSNNIQKEHGINTVRPVGLGTNHNISEYTHKQDYLTLHTCAHIIALKSVLQYIHNREAIHFPPMHYVRGGATHIH